MYVCMYKKCKIKDVHLFLIRMYMSRVGNNLQSLPKGH